MNRSSVKYGVIALLSLGVGTVFGWWTWSNNTHQPIVDANDVNHVERRRGRTDPPRGPDVAAGRKEALSAPATRKANPAATTKEADPEIEDRSRQAEMVRRMEEDLVRSQAPTVPTIDAVLASSELNPRGVELHSYEREELARLIDGVNEVIAESYLEVSRQTNAAFSELYRRGDYGVLDRNTVLSGRGDAMFERIASLEDRTTIVMRIRAGDSYPLDLSTEALRVAKEAGAEAVRDYLSRR